MPGDIQAISAATGVPEEKLRDHALRTVTDAAAMAEPVPGAVRDALLGTSPLKVGGYAVRACYDGDIEYLSLLEHPLNELRLRTAAISAEDAAQREKEFQDIWKGFVESHQYRGPMAWQLCYLLTRSLDDVDAVFANGGLDGIRSAAKKEFSRVTPTALMQLTPACVTQYLRSWNTVLTHGAAEESDDGPKKN